MLTRVVLVLDVAGARKYEMQRLVIVLRLVQHIWYVGIAEN